MCCLPPTSLVKKGMEPILKGIAPLIGKRLSVVCLRLAVSCGKKENLHTSKNIYFLGPSCVLTHSESSSVAEGERMAA